MTMRVLVLALVAGVAVPAPAQRLGYTYTVRATGEQAAHGTAHGAGYGRQPTYTARATVIESRARLDILSGGADSMYGPGDYVIFDSTGTTVVRPAKRQIIHLSRDTGPVEAEQLKSMGIALTLSDEKVVLDSLGPSDTISSVPTRHYRMTVAFNMRMDDGLMKQRMATESVTDYWVALIPEMRENPLLRVNALAVAIGKVGLFGTLSSRVDLAAGRMGQAVSLRTRSTTRVMLGPGESTETRDTIEISDLRRITVDDSVFTPSAYPKNAP